MNEIKTGDLFYTSWGYDQTNYDYIIVTKVSPSGKTCICQRAKAENVGYASQCNLQKPIQEAYGNSFRMKVAGWNGVPQLRGTYIYCGDNNKRFDIFSPVTKNKVYYETDSMFGH